jgi:hypothetical protein
MRALQVTTEWQFLSTVAKEIKPNVASVCAHGVSGGHALAYNQHLVT